MTLPLPSPTRWSHPPFPPFLPYPLFLPHTLPKTPLVSVRREGGREGEREDGGWDSGRGESISLFPHSLRLYPLLLSEGVSLSLLPHSQSMARRSPPPPPRSRLGCQIKVSEVLRDAVIRIPDEFNNLYGGGGGSA